jgi:hypothetical protein
MHSLPPPLPPAFAPVLELLLPPVPAPDVNWLKFDVHPA